MKKYILVIITILWMIIIFTYSNQKSIQSTNRSQSFISNTIVRIYKLFNNNPSDKDIENIINIWEVPIRKTAHFMEFFILGILIYLTFKEFNINNIYIMLLFCFLYACSDEIHQLFVVGRDGNAFDVMIDSLGSSIATLILNKINRRKV